MDDYEITLNTIRLWAEQTLETMGSLGGYLGEQMTGYRNAVRDVKAILDMHGKPANQPVVFTRD